MLKLVSTCLYNYIDGKFIENVACNLLITEKELALVHFIRENNNAFNPLIDSGFLPVQIPNAVIEAYTLFPETLKIYD